VEIEAMFDPIRVTRTTAETRFEVILEPRNEPMSSLPISNRLLSHFIDHFALGSGVNVRVCETDWPGSWRFDHVLCEDLGQLIGRGLAAIHDRRANRTGVRGRARSVCCMDDAEAEIAISFEQRPRADWTIPDRTDIDGFVDAWYDEDGRVEGQAYGTNLRQFIDGFVLGAGATVSVVIRRSGNLHHLYEVVFRALGDAVGDALGTAVSRLPGDTSGLARACEYKVRTEER
jgi:imidazoleglycerol phosphate dehydratase HisB